MTERNIYEYLQLVCRQVGEHFPDAHVQIGLTWHDENGRTGFATTGVGNILARQRCVEKMVDAVFEQEDKDEDSSSDIPVK